MQIEDAAQDLPEDDDVKDISIRDALTDAIKADETANAELGDALDASQEAEEAAVAKAEEPVPEDADPAPDATDAKAEEPAPEDATPAPDASADAAPMDWGPEAREVWKDVPEAAKKHIQAREAQINQMLNDGAESRKLGEQFAQAVQPYKALLEAEGVQHPLQAVNNMMGIVSALRTGSKNYRAQTMAQLIKAYDIDINTLDQVLAGEQLPPEQQQPQDFQRMVDQAVNARLQPMYQQQQSAVDAEVRDFAEKHEFFKDALPYMRSYMADAAQRGQNLSMEEAYNMACQAHPSISKVLQERNAQAALAEREQKVTAKLAASRSIAGDASGNAGANSGDPTSIRGILQEQITAAMQG